MLIWNTKKLDNFKKIRGLIRGAWCESHFGLFPGNLHRLWSKNTIVLGSLGKMQGWKQWNTAVHLLKGISSLFVVRYTVMEVILLFSPWASVRIILAIAFIEAIGMLHWSKEVINNDAKSIGSILCDWKLGQIDPNTACLCYYTP